MSEESVERAVAEEKYKSACLGQHMTADEYAAFDAGWDAAYNLVTTREREAREQEREQLSRFFSYALADTHTWTVADIVKAIRARAQAEEGKSAEDDPFVLLRQLRAEIGEERFRAFCEDQR